MADLTLADLDCIEALHAVATQGEWKSDDEGIYIFTADGIMVADTPLGQFHLGDVPIMRARGTGFGLSDEQQAANMRVAAVAVNALPALLRLARLGVEVSQRPGTPVHLEPQDMWYGCLRESCMICNRRTRFWTMDGHTPLCPDCALGYRQEETADE